MNTKENKTNKQTDDDFIKFLKEKKAKDGKLSKTGEWILSGKAKDLGLYVLPDNMKYILR